MILRNVALFVINLLFDWVIKDGYVFSHLMKTLFLTLVAFFAAFLCSARTANCQFPDIVPCPQNLEVASGIFCAKGAQVVTDEDLDNLSLSYIKDFAEHLAKVSNGTTSRSKIVFSKDKSLSAEQYTLKINSKNVLIKASGLNGFVYAVQTLKQMMPVEVYGNVPAPNANWNIPCCTINDSPRFKYRGMLLDVARHFFTVEQVKKFIDMMEILKMNVFHWHLTDDQGWRIEIKRYPELTNVGSRRRETLVGHHHTSNTYDGQPYGEGMWYTQDQIRDVVRYAASKGIKVIPEIDLPGHMMGAIATYPSLGCTGGPYEVLCKWGISDDVLCAGKQESYAFLENVLEEVCELFPSEYIHIGGDECPKVRWEKCPACQAKIAELGLKGDDLHSAEHYLQSHIMRHMSEFLATKGKKIVGWEEMLQGELPPGSTVMAWRRNKYAHQAARLGHDAIISTRTFLYLDRYQSKDKDNEPLAHSSYLPVDLVWSCDPFVSEEENAQPLTENQKSHILGVQANVWTEYIPNNTHMEYMVHPRMAAVSEVQWCHPENKDWGRFLRALDKMKERYDIMGYNYARHIWNKGNGLK